MQAKIGELWLQTCFVISFLYDTHNSKTKGRTRGKKFSIKINYKQGQARKKDRNKAGMKTHAGKLSCYRKIVVKKDWKTTLLQLPDYATDVELFSCLDRQHM